MGHVGVHQRTRRGSEPRAHRLEEGASLVGGVGELALDQLRPLRGERANAARIDRVQGRQRGADGLEDRDPVGGGDAIPDLAQRHTRQPPRHQVRPALELALDVELRPPHRRVPIAARTAATSSVEGSSEAIPRF